MKLSINLTENFNFWIDYTGVSGLKTYIDTAICINMSNYLQFTLFNFVLNLDDDIIHLINSQNPIFSQDLKEDCFFIIKKAEFHFGQVKGIDILMRGLDKEYYQTLDYTLSKDDSIYEIGGYSVNLPYGIINMAIISQQPVTMEFNLADCEYFNDYSLFTQRTQQLNLMMTNPLPKKGQFFDVNFRKKHLQDDSQKASL